MEECKTIEFKEKMTDSFLKTVSAYANYGSGTIYFGITDDGEEIGVENPKRFCLDLENKINDNIHPKPDFSISSNKKTNVISLRVQEGQDKPYTFKGKAYRRSESATVEVDRIALNRLILEGSEKNFEELSSKNQDLHFSSLAYSLSEKVGISEVTPDILKTLELYSPKNEFNIAAALLSDENAFPGIDIVRFGSSIDEIMDRHSLENQSVLSMYEKAIAVYKTYYQLEKIDGIERKTIELVPEKAFREAVANAIVHRTWDVNARIRIEMFSDKILVNSPGGLPTGITEEEYLDGRVSILRNPVLASVFFRLHLIEKFGTGIRRIKSAYKDLSVKPDFFISENSIGILLPIISAQKAVSSSEQKILDSLSTNQLLSSSEIAEKSGFSKNTVIRLTDSLCNNGLIQIVGNGRGTKYKLKK